MGSGKLNMGQSPAAKLKALRELREASASRPEAEQGVLQKYVPPAEAKDRLRIIADDSGSMNRHIPDVREGVIEFFRNCIPGQTAAAVHMLCTPDNQNNLSLLNSNLIELATWMKLVKFGGGGTPLFSTLKRALEAQPQATRLVAFTDGSPTDTLVPWINWEEQQKLKLLFSRQRDADVIVEQAVGLKVPIDTVFFGSAEKVRDYNWETGEEGPEKDRDEVLLLKYLAERTGGFFLHFDPSKMDFKKGLKYLAPSLRLMLADKSVRKEIESGKRA